MLLHTWRASDSGHPHFEGGEAVSARQQLLVLHQASAASLGGWASRNFCRPCNTVLGAVVQPQSHSGFGLPRGKVGLPRRLVAQAPVAPADENCFMLARQHPLQLS